jgi:hypothetical protein
MGRKEGRAPLDDQPTLLARVLMGDIETIARARDLRGYYRVAYKKNGDGHHVVALIFEPQPP